MAKKIQEPEVEAQQSSADDSSDEEAVPPTPHTVASKSNPKPVVGKRGLLLLLEGEGEGEESNKDRVEGVVESEKKCAGLFQRKWSHEDEIVLLQGMLDYKKVKGVDPVSNMGDFHNYIRKSLHVVVHRRKQVTDKVCRLRNTYWNTSGSGSGKKKNKKKKMALTPHDEKAIQLSKLIWGETVAPSHVAINTRSLDSKAPPVGVTFSYEGWKFIGKGCVRMGLNENMTKAGLDLSSHDTKAQIEDKWKQFHLEKGALFIRKMELVLQETKMIMEALKSLDD